MKKSILIAFISLFLLAGTFIFLYHRNSVKSQEIARYEQNWKAARDSIEYYQLKNGELMAEKQSYILNEREMLQQLQMSNDEVKDLKKQLGSALATITRIEGQVSIDSIYIESEPIYVDVDTLVAPIKYNDEWLKLDGMFRYGSGRTITAFDNISINTPLTVGLAENGKYFVTSANPYVQISDINSVISEKVVPKKKHWSIGVGIGPSVGYDLKHKDIYYGIGGTIGIQYNF